MISGVRGKLVDEEIGDYQGWGKQEEQLEKNQGEGGSQKKERRKDKRFFFLRIIIVLMKKKSTCSD